MRRAVFPFTVSLWGTPQAQCRREQVCVEHRLRYRCRSRLYRLQASLDLTEKRERGKSFKTFSGILVFAHLTCPPSYQEAYISPAPHRKGICETEKHNRIHKDEEAPLGCFFVFEERKNIVRTGQWALSRPLGGSMGDGIIKRYIR